MSNRTYSVIVSALMAMHLVKTAAFIAAGQPAMVNDPLQYWHYGHCAASGDLLLLAPAEVIRTPGYPWFLALFQATCGPWSFIVATAAQQFLVLLTAVLTAWMSWLATRSRFAVIVALSLALSCLSQNGSALYLCSDTLFCTLLALATTIWIRWLQRPSVWAALALGGALGMAILVKPIAELAFVPLVLVMLVRLRPFSLRRSAVHIACLCMVMLVVGESWRLRNQIRFGHPFLTKISGVCLWWSCFKQTSNVRFDPRLPFAADATTLQVTREAGHVDLASAWAVRFELMRLGHSEIETDDLMASVVKSAILAHPWKYFYSRCVHFIWFWITPNGTSRPEPGSLSATSANVMIAAEETPAGQATWRASWYFDRGLFNVVWRPSSALFGLATVAVAVGLVSLMSRPQYRLLGVSFLLWFLYFSSITVVAGNPEYRYRMILEPAMIVVVASACALEFESRWPAKDVLSGLSPSSTL